MTRNIEPKPIVVAEILSIGTPAQEHTGRVTIGYVLRNQQLAHCGQGNLVFEGDEAKAAISDPMAAVAARLGLKLLPEEVKAEAAPLTGRKSELTNVAAEEAPGAASDVKVVDAPQVAPAATPEKPKQAAKPAGGKKTGGKKK